MGRHLQRHLRHHQGQPWIRRQFQPPVSEHVENGGYERLQDKPHWISGSGASATIAGTVYTGSVWVKADVVGEKITLFLRELNRAGAPSTKLPTTSA